MLPYAILFHFHSYTLTFPHWFVWQLLVLWLNWWLGHLQNGKEIIASSFENYPWPDGSHHASNEKVYRDLNKIPHIYSSDRSLLPCLKKRADKHGHYKAQWLSVQIKHNKQSAERQKQLWAIDRYTAHRDTTRLRALKNITGQQGSSATREILPLIQPHNKSRPPETTVQPQRNSQQTTFSVFTATLALLERLAWCAKLMSEVCLGRAVSKVVITWHAKPQAILTFCSNV